MVNSICLEMYYTIGGIYELIEDILTLLPQDEIFILFFDKLDKNSNFKHLIRNIGSQEFARKYESLKVNTIKVYIFSLVMYIC